MVDNEGPNFFSSCKKFRRRKNNTLALLVLFATGCVAFNLMGIAAAEAVAFALAFPFAQTGDALRFLSLSGGVGNAAALGLYAAICLSPIGAPFLINRKRGLKPEDALLPLLGVLLFAIMYRMVNPGPAVPAFGWIPGPPAYSRMAMGGVVWSVALAYAAVRFIRRIFAAGDASLLRYMRAMLHGMNAVFVVAAFGVRFGHMLAAFDALRAGNAGSGPLGLTYVFLALRFGVSALPYLLNVWVAFAALRLLSALGAGPHGDETVAAARNMSRVCAVSLAASGLAYMAFNLGQLLFAQGLRVVHIEVNVPLVPVLLVVGALLFSRYMALGRALREENEGFV